MVVVVVVVEVDVVVVGGIVVVGDVFIVLVVGIVVVVGVVVVRVTARTQQSNPSGNPAPQLSKSLWQERLALQSESVSQSPSPSKQGHSSLQHAQLLWAPPQSDGHPK